MPPTKANHPAFPETEYFDEKPVGQNEGMTKREYFAAAALQGILAGNSDLMNANSLGSDVGVAAEFAVKAADCLVKELNYQG